MRPWSFLFAMFVATNATGDTATSKLWSELKTQRDKLPGLHQEFDFTQTFKADRTTQTLHRQVFLDMSQRKWRERSVSGSGDRLRIFDGDDLFEMEPEGDEYVRTKHKANEPDPAPAPYGSIDLDWAKAAEVERRPCGFSENDHSCIVVDAPVKTWTRVGTGSHLTRMLAGITRLVIDSQTGVLIQAYTHEQIDNQRGGYQLSWTYSLKRVNYGLAANAALFNLPENGLHEVKKLTPWNLSRIRKQLVGKRAPELEVTDIQGNPILLSNLRGKTVLLDFWTSWCPPCLADAPALEKLNHRYADQLAIVGISVNEERAIVEKFLKDHPTAFR